MDSTRVRIGGGDQLSTEELLESHWPASAWRPFEPKMIDDDDDDDDFFDDDADDDDDDFEDDDFDDDDFDDDDLDEDLEVDDDD